MGFVGAYLYDGAGWSSAKHDQQPAVAGPWLMVDINGDNIARISYSPAEPGSGTAYLHASRAHLDNATASPPVDTGREAEGLANWWAQRQQNAGETDLEAKRQQIAEYLTDSDDAHPDGAGDETDFSEVYVELKTSRFLVALDLPVPDALLT